MDRHLRFLEARVPPPLVMLAIAAGMWQLAPLTPAIPVPDVARHIVAGALAASGAAFDLAGLIAFRRARTTVNPLKPGRASQIVEAGVYRITRNPMYLGLLLMLLALTAYLAAPFALTGPLAFVGYINRFQIVPEERAMEMKFGAAYAAYRARVRRWI